MNCAARVFHGAARVAQATHTSARRGGKLGSRALCRSSHRLRTEVSGVRGQAFESLMAANAVVEIEVDADTPVRLGDRAVGVQVHLFVLHAPPESLDEDVVNPAAFAIHADLDIGVFEYFGKVLAGELAALVGVEDLRGAVLGDRLLQ